MRLSEPDRLLALGSLDFKSEIKARATRKGDTIHIQGVVSHNGNDEYDFSDNDEAYGAYEVQQSGRGKPFWVRQNWHQKVTGTVKILGTENSGRLILGQSRFRWADID